MSTSIALHEKLALRIGIRIVSLVRFLGGGGRLTIQVFTHTFSRPFYFRLLFEQMFLVGVRSFLLVAVTGLAVGSVMALQFGLGLAKFGGKLYVPNVVGLAILREMGPVFTGLLVAGRIGSGIAAEVGSMKVTQQVDAIRALGTSPIRKIVVPRVLATVITLPILTIFANYIGLFGAMVVSYYELGINQEYFFSKVLEMIRISDLTTGLAKSVFFAFFISITACWKGLNTEGGTQGVGNTTTWVVVTSSIFILISDYFLTKVFFHVFYIK